MPEVDSRVVQRIAQLKCRLTKGHGPENTLKVFEGRKMYLQCRFCGWKSEGVDVGEPAFVDYQEVYECLMQTELLLHGGG